MPAVASDRPGRVSSELAAFALIGCGLLALFGSLVARFPLLHYFPGPGVTIGFDEIFGKDWLQGSWWWLSVFTGGFCLLGAACLLVPCRPSRSALAVVFGFPALFAAALIYMYPAAAIDVIHYYAAARTLWVYHQNPMAVPVNAHRFIVGVSFADRASPYGPLWQVLTGPTTVLAGNHWTWGVLGLKLIAAIAYLACAWLIYLIMRRLRPQRALLAVVLFAWNPFVAFRAVGNGHNDIFLVAFLLLAIYCIVSERWLWVFPALAASVLVKYVSLLLGPLFAIYILQLAYQRRDRRILVQSAVGAALAGLMSLALIALFWDQQAFLHSARLALEPITSSPLVLSIWLTGKVAAGSELSVAVNLLRAAFAGVYLLVLLKSRPNPERLISGCILILFAYLVLPTVWFRPWYFLWFVPLTVLQPSRWYVALGLAASYVGSMVDLVEHYRVHMAWLVPHELALVAAPVVVQFLLPCLLLIAALILTHSPDLRQPDAETEAPRAAVA